MRDALLPRNVTRLLERTTEEYSPLEKWQEEFLRNKKLEEAGFDLEDEWVPMNLGTVEDEQAWREDLLQMVEDPNTRSGYRYAGPRRVGDAFDASNPMHVAAAKNDVEAREVTDGED